MFDRCTSTNGRRTASNASRTAKLVCVKAAALTSAPSARPGRPWIASTSSPSWFVCVQLSSTPSARARSREREPELYGRATLAEVEARTRERARLDLRQRRSTVQLGFSLAQEIQVRSVQHRDVHYDLRPFSQARNWSRSLSSSASGRVSGPALPGGSDVPPGEPAVGPPAAAAGAAAPKNSSNEKPPPAGAV